MYCSIFRNHNINNLYYSNDSILVLFKNLINKQTKKIGKKIFGKTQEKIQTL